jgi:hypothetical protein
MRIEYQLTVGEFNEVARREARRTQRVMVGLIGAAVVLNAVVFVPQWLSASSGAATPPSQSGGVVREYAPWLLVFLVIWMIVFTRMRGSTRSEWDRRPGFGLPKAVEFLPDRVYVVDAVSRAEHLWPAFQQVIETPGTFAFMIDGAPVIVLPKRALGSTEALGAFRAMLLAAMPGRVTLG